MYLAQGLDFESHHTKIIVLYSLEICTIWRVLKYPGTWAAPQTN